MNTEALASLRLLQLASPALPVGAYAYSQGLEYAIEASWIHDADTIEDWLTGALLHNQTELDIPVLARLDQGWQQQDMEIVQDWNEFLFAARETAELQAEEQHLGRALARLLTQQSIAAARPWQMAEQVCFATLFSLAANQWQINLHQTALGYVWSWAENQVLAASKLIPLGQTAAQQLLSRIQPKIIQAVEQGLQLADEEIGSSLPGMVLASCYHETQYSRLFRS